MSRAAERQAGYLLSALLYGGGSPRVEQQISLTRVLRLPGIII